MRLSLVFVVLVLCGCDPEVEIVGSVFSADGGAAANTKVELKCTGGPQLAVPTSVETDRNGRFKLTGKGCLPSSCVLSSGEGFRRSEQHLMEWCKKSAPSCAPGSCTNAAVTLTLPQ